jgi:lysophospholipase L1-like esterase
MIENCFSIMLHSVITMTRNFLYLLPLLIINCTSKEVMPDNSFTFLALGDSYTIGESVAEASRFPEQAVQMFSQKSIRFSKPEIIATTGWTTGNLLNAISTTVTHPPYDLVTLLIGVNNQYQGRSLTEYEHEFELLLNKAVEFAGYDKTRIIVFSIPDWGATPFAAGRNRQQISAEIDAFNSINKKISNNKNVQYIDITPGTREAMQDIELVASDGLHPSPKEYFRWANALVTLIEHRYK